MLPPRGITLDIYSHAVPAMQEEAAVKAATLVLGTAGSEKRSPLAGCVRLLGPLWKPLGFVTNVSVDDQVDPIQDQQQRQSQVETQARKSSGPSRSHGGTWLAPRDLQHNGCTE